MKNTTITPISSRIDKYNSNWQIFIYSSEDDNHSEGELFSGNIYGDLDGLDEEDRELYEDQLEEVAHASTLEEAEELMDKYSIGWNCTL